MPFQSAMRMPTAAGAVRDMNKSHRIRRPTPMPAKMRAGFRVAMLGAGAGSGLTWSDLTGGICVKQADESEGEPLEQQRRANF